MLNKKMLDELNTHLNRELYSSLLYLSMSSAAGKLGLKGAANWFMVQHQEEMAHFMKFYAYINSQGEQALLSTQPEPAATFCSLLDMLEQTLKHEQYITASINELVDLSLIEKDHATHIFLQWFVTEQIEEEENDRDLIAKLRLIGDNGQGLLMLDAEMGARVFTPPPVL